MDALGDSVVTVYGKKGCSYCENAMNLLNTSVESKVQYIDVGEDKNTVSILKDRTNGHSTFPFIFFGNTFIGGFRELVEVVETTSIMGVDTIHSIKLKENDF